MRVFAGPNGSGKSTLFNLISQYKQNNRHIDLGVFVNADEITTALLNGNFKFSRYRLRVSQKEFSQAAEHSGLIGTRFTESEFRNCHRFIANRVLLRNSDFANALAQVIADLIRKKLLDNGHKFSFETVFSHESKLEILRDARNRGYKVYLYYVATESPEISIERVKLRVKNKGHDVAPALVIARYERSLDLMYEATQSCHQAYFFDNSGSELQMFGHFRLEGQKKKWDKMKLSEVPFWFYKYYSLKTKRK